MPPSATFLCTTLFSVSASASHSGDLQAQDELEHFIYEIDALVEAKEDEGIRMTDGRLHLLVTTRRHWALEVGIGPGDEEERVGRALE